MAAGCADEPTRPAEPGAVRHATDAAGQPPPVTIVDDLGIVQRIELSLTASGSFRPGQPLTVRAVPRANLATPDAHIELLAIGADTASYGPSKVTVPGLQVAAAQRGAAGVGALTPVVSTVSFKEPGIYKVVAVATSKPADGETPAQLHRDGVRAVNDLTVRTLYVRVDEAGGRAGSTFADVASGDSTRAPRFGGVGPFRPTHEAAGVQRGPAREPVGAARSGGGVTALASGYSVYGRGTVYYNEFGQTAGTRVAATVPDAEVQVLCYDQSYYYYQIQNTRTDTQGAYAYTCPAGYTSLAHINVSLKNVWADVRGQNGASTTTTVYAYSAGYPPTIYMSNDYAAHVHRRLREYGPRFVDVFGRTRPAVAVWVDSTVAGNSSVPGLGTSSERMQIYNDDVFGEAGTFVTTHEYAHAYHYRAIEAWYATSGNQYCANRTSVQAQTTLDCAFVEGFADAAAVYIAGDRLTSASNYTYTDYYFEPNYFLFGAFITNPGQGGSGDGVIIEGAVAAVFLDMLDGVNDPDERPGDDDSIEGYANNWGRYIADVMRTCTVTTAAGTAYYLSGMDEFLACAQNDAGARRDAPSTAWRAHTAATESATEPAGWSQGTIKALWQYNLYNLGSLP